MKTYIFRPSSNKKFSVLCASGAMGTAPRACSSPRRPWLRTLCAPSGRTMEYYLQRRHSRSYLLYKTSIIERRTFLHFQNIINIRWYEINTGRCEGGWEMISSWLSTGTPLVRPSPLTLPLYYKVQQKHRVGWVLSFFSSLRTWDSPTPSHAGERVPPPPAPSWGGTRLQERGWGVPIRTRGHSGTLDIYVLCE